MWRTDILRIGDTEVSQIAGTLALLGLCPEGGGRVIGHKGNKIIMRLGKKYSTC